SRLPPLLSLIPRRPPTPPLFPYTPLFRSEAMAFVPGKQRGRLRQGTQRRLVNQPLRVDRTVVDRLYGSRHVLRGDCGRRRENRAVIVEPQQDGLFEGHLQRAACAGSEPRVAAFAFGFEAEA